MRAGSTWPLAVVVSSLTGSLVTARRVVQSEFDGNISRSLAVFNKAHEAAPPPVVATSPKEHRVTALPGLKDGDFPTKQYAGHIPVVDGFHFYWLFESASEDPSSDPLVIWLNGGPGCSSMDGLWLENGPFRLVDSDHKIAVNPYSWHKAANVMYVDQPVGTGLSFTTKANYADNDFEVDQQFYQFLANFFELHSEFKAEGGKTRPIFFTGESHAGHYIPSMVAYILEQNEAVVAAGKGELVMDVQGMMIGNGWIDPASQYDVSDYAFGMGLIDAGQRRALKKKEEDCLKLIGEGNYNDHKCMALMDSVVAASGGKASMVPEVSMYDVRKYELGRQFPPGHAIVEAYLNRDDVRAAIHAASCPIQFKECTDPPFRHLAKWDGLGVTNELRSALNAGVRSLFFNGQYDLICNHVGNQKALERLGGWKGVEEWESSTRGVWLSDGKGDDDGGHRRPIGYAKEKPGNPLTFLIVLNSGHMVPLDQPRSALDMLKRFLRDEPFSDSAQSALGVGSCSGEDALDCSEIPGCASPPSAAGEVSLPPPPKIVGTPSVGRDSATVEFTPGEGEGEGGEAAAAAAATVSFFEARSSPEGIVGVGSESPLVVDGLTPGRAYTFSVTAVYSAGGGGGGGGGAGGEEAEMVRSRPSVGSPAVTPGCRQGDGGGGAACGGHGVCRAGGQEGVCLCEDGYAGDDCEILQAGGVRGGAGGALIGPGAGLQVAADHADDILILLEENLPALPKSAKEGGSGCEVVMRFFLRPGAFRDPEFVVAIRKPRVLPPDNKLPETGDAGTPAPLPGTSGGGGAEALDEQGAAFSALLRADVGQALGVSMTSVSVGGVFPAGETAVDWNAWRQWGAGALNVSVVVESDAPEDTGRRLLSAWNDPTSRLHAGTITSLIDFSQGAEVTFAFSPEKTPKPFRGPTLLATMLYLACFALAVPACGMSRRFFSRRRRSVSGGLGANSGPLSDGGGGPKRRGWRAPLGKGGGGGRAGGSRDGEDVQEMVPLAGEEDGEWGRRERARV